MKSVLLLSMVAMINCNAQELIRLIGTNLYDFTPVASVTNTPYRLVGVVDRVYPQSVKMRVGTGKIEYRFEPAFSPQGPYQTLDIAAAGRIGEKPISQAQYLTLSRFVAQHFKPYEITREAYVLNCPTVRPGDLLEVLAVPTTNAMFWDCGVFFNGSTTNFNKIHRVHANRVVVDHLRKNANRSGE